MSEPAAEPRQESQEKERECPMCAILDCLSQWRSRSAAAEHLKNAQIELLKGVRSLIDERITRVEQAARRRAARATKIKVE